jgi:predicted AAA+ superfamily ATPase
VFLLTGSSARKLKYHAGEINFLPGRVRLFRLDPFSLSEWNDVKIEDLLMYGSLPEVLLTEHMYDREEFLRSYVETYLEEEVRKESLVRRLDSFVRFLELAAIDSGKISSFNHISKQLGVAHTTIASHYQILEDCLIVDRIAPYTKSLTRKKLMRSPKLLFFDLGVRRIAAGEGIDPTPERYGELFEHWVGLELVRSSRMNAKDQVMYWRDPDGPEVDWIYKRDSELTPIKVKWTDKPTPAHAKHLELFISEYPKLAKKGFLVCRVKTRKKLTEHVDAIPWNELAAIYENTSST